MPFHEPLAAGSIFRTVRRFDPVLSVPCQSPAMDWAVRGADAQSAAKKKRAILFTDDPRFVGPYVVISINSSRGLSRGLNQWRVESGGEIQMKVARQIRG